MKLTFLFLAILAGAFVLVAPPARAQADPAPVAVQTKDNAAKWTPPAKVEWSQADPDSEASQEGEWLDGVEALQKKPEYSAREARRVRRDTLRAGKLDRKAARHVRNETRAAEKPRRIKN
jgi:hypothetical protein